MKNGINVIVNAAIIQNALTIVLIINYAVFKHVLRCLMRHLHMILEANGIILPGYLMLIYHLTALVFFSTF